MSVCVLCVRQKRDNYVSGLEGGTYLLSSSLEPVISKNDGVLHVLQRGPPLPQHYNYLVNILAASIDYLANPITEPPIDPSASSPTISTLSKETLNSTPTIGSLTA